MTENANKVLSTIINCQFACYTCCYAPEKAVVPISNILYLNTGMTRYAARKALKELIAEGLIFYTHQGQPAVESGYEYKELVCKSGPPINGYALTEDGFKCDKYKERSEQFDKDLLMLSSGDHDNE